MLKRNSINVHLNTGQLALGICFSKIRLVGQKYPDQTTLANKTRFSRHCFVFQSRRFSPLVGYNI